MTFFGEPIFEVSHVFRGVLRITISHHRDRKEGTVDRGQPFSTSNIKENTRL
jgi:hypothetical protein